MYDILQLNDMLVPELLDIAEQLKIPNAKKLNKQELVYKILDSQAVAASEGSSGNAAEKGRRKRIVKASTANTVEEAEVMTEEKPREKKAAVKTKEKETVKEEAAKKKPVKKAKKETEEETDDEETAEDETKPGVNDIDLPELGSRIFSMFGGDDGVMPFPEEEIAEEEAETEEPGHRPAKPYRREPAFNIEFDGVIQSEGVLEMMPDGYGFLRSSDYHYLSSP
ncbi:MAG TPA: Rho termination factor N-terminal domain-containing protein, partial [Chitinophagaceae bacterium]|nr:Rho termination factor N-terminal domain-containing protein [Chitinophagaceae bacterium]